MIDMPALHKHLKRSLIDAHGLRVAGLLHHSDYEGSLSGKRREKTLLRDLPSTRLQLPQRQQRKARESITFASLLLGLCLWMLQWKLCFL